MARKRITAEDILDFRAKADELSHELEIKYEKLEKSAKPIEDVEEREKGILVIHHSDVDRDAVRAFVRSAKNAGYAAELVELDSTKKRTGKPERIVLWQRMLEQAQSGYLNLGEHSVNIAVLGIGDAAPVATIIAEQYPVDALMIVGGGPALKPFAASRDFSRLAALARNNLFSVVCPVLAVVPSDCGAAKPQSAKLYKDETRSDRVEIEDRPGVSVSQMWTDSEQSPEKRIFEFVNSL